MSLDLNHKKPSLRGRSLEAVIVCVDYSDFLEETLHRNKVAFDHVVVVTTHEDKATQRVCRHNNIDPVLTDAFFHDGAPFCKAAGINVGLAHLRYSDWILHLDADILLPHDFRNQLWNASLQRDCIYGADRQNVVGREAYEALVSSYHFRHLYRDKFVVKLPELDLGARLVHAEFGYAPIGFFQLFNGAFIAQHHLKYPVNQRNAERSDVQFALQWKRANRHLLPTTSVFHLESENSKQGTNWNGRRTREF